LQQFMVALNLSEGMGKRSVGIDRLSPNGLIQDCEV
jgi:hypothetical protein